ncbi:class I SAM-dependent methyltransferase, partial [bacterium]|nr:class I SAM-dependent methyltransferase [bacterium]
MNVKPSFEHQKALDYISELLPAVESLKIDGNKLDSIPVQPTVGFEAAALLDVLVRSFRPQRILEIGTSYGFSACVLGRAAKSYGGTVTTLEINEMLANIARQNVEAANLQDVVEIKIGDANRALQEKMDSFGVVVQDGHKNDYTNLLNRLVELLEPGGLLISDDVLFPVMTLPPSAESWRIAMLEY